MFRIEGRRYSKMLFYMYTKKQSLTVQISSLIINITFFHMFSMDFATKTPKEHPFNRLD